MPIFFFYGPELDAEKKRELIKSVTEKTSISGCGIQEKKLIRERRLL